MKDYFSNATRRSGQTVWRTPSFPPKQNNISIFKERSKENNNCNQDDDDDDDDDDHGIERLRHNRMFLDKREGWCHTIVLVVPQGATRRVKI